MSKPSIHETHAPTFSQQAIADAGGDPHDEADVVTTKPADVIVAVEGDDHLLATVERLLDDRAALIEACRASGASDDEIQQLDKERQDAVAEIAEAKGLSQEDASRVVLAAENSVLQASRSGSVFSVEEAQAAVRRASEAAEAKEEEIKREKDRLVPRDAPVIKGRDEPVRDTLKYIVLAHFQDFFGEGAVRALFAENSDEVIAENLSHAGVFRDAPDSATREDLVAVLADHRRLNFPGTIVDAAKAAGQTVDLNDLAAEPVEVERGFGTINPWAGQGKPADIGAALTEELRRLVRDKAKKAPEKDPFGGAAIVLGADTPGCECRICKVRRTLVGLFERDGQLKLEGLDTPTLIELGKAISDHAKAVMETGSIVPGPELVDRMSGILEKLAAHAEEKAGPVGLPTDDEKRADALVEEWLGRRSGFTIGLLASVDDEKIAVAINTAQAGKSIRLSVLKAAIRRFWKNRL